MYYVQYQEKENTMELNNIIASLLGYYMYFARDYKKSKVFYNLSLSRVSIYY